MTKKYDLLGILLIVIIFGTYAAGCATTDKTGSKFNFYNFGDVSEDNCAYILVSPVRELDGNIWSLSNYVKINGQGDRNLWPRSSASFNDREGRAIVRLTPGEYTFTITALTENTRREIPINIRLNVQENKGYIFSFGSRTGQTPTMNNITVTEFDDVDDGNFGTLGSLLRGKHHGREAVKRTETAHVTNTLIGVDDRNMNTTPTFNNDAGDLAGRWRGTVMGQTATIVVSNSGWTLSIPTLSYSDTGNFNRNGNSAVLYSSSNGRNVGTANIISATQMQIVLNANSDAPGTYTVTKQ